MKLRWLSREIFGELELAANTQSPVRRIGMRAQSVGAQIGFGDFTEEERRQFAPVQQRLIRRHPSTGQKSLYLASHAGTIVGWPTELWQSVVAVVSMCPQL
jgi:hypothetical protein